MPAAVIASYAKEYKVPKKKVEEFWATAKKEYGEDYEKVSGTTKKMCQNYAKSKNESKYEEYLDQLEEGFFKSDKIEDRIVGKTEEEVNQKLDKFMKDNKGYSPAIKGNVKKPLRMSGGQFYYVVTMNKKSNDDDKSIQGRLKRGLGLGDKEYTVRSKGEETKSEKPESKSSEKVKIKSSNEPIVKKDVIDKESQIKKSNTISSDEEKIIKNIEKLPKAKRLKVIKSIEVYNKFNECKYSNERAGLEDFDETKTDMPKTKKKKKEVKESNVDKLLRVFEGKEVEEITEALDTKMKVGVKKAMEMMKKMYPTHKADWDKETLLFDVDGKLHGQWENGTLHYKFKKSEEK